jgi:probable rRNA maturation factor
LIEINCVNDQDKIEIPEEIEGILEQVILETLNHEKIDKFCEISILFVDNGKIRDLNRDYRDNDKETDVLSFPQYESIEEINGEGEFILLGDVVISLEKALEQSKEYGHSFIREISYLTVHSILHLLGYDHMKDGEKKIMRDKEEAILEELEIFR